MMGAVWFVSTGIVKMSGLADELLAELAGLSGEENEEEEQESETPPSSTLAEASSNIGQKRKAEASVSDDEMLGGEEEETDEDEAGLVLEGGVKPADELDAEDVQQMELGDIDDIGKIAKLESSKRMMDVLKAWVYFPSKYFVIYQFHRRLKDIEKTHRLQRKWCFLRTQTRNTMLLCKQIICL